MDLQTAREWLDRFGVAWRDRDPGAVADLFTVDAIYFSHPFRAPLRGWPQITDYWFTATAKQSGIEVTFGDPVVDGDRVAVEWWSVMNEDGRSNTDAGGLFLTFEEGSCAVLREYWNLTEGAVRLHDGWGR